MDSINIKISQVHKQEFKNLRASQLILLLKGTSVNEVLVNTLRRISQDIIPTYAFPADNITIEKNSSIFNNDHMRLRLSQITIPNISIKIHYLEDKYWKDVDFKNPEREKHPDDKKLIEMYVNAANNTTDIMSVTTEHVKIYEDGVELTDKFDSEYPHLIVQLKPNDIFNCRCVGILSIGLVNNIWAAAGNAYYKDITDTEYKLTIESQGQLDEYEILHKGCRVIKEKIKMTKKLIKEKYESVSTNDIFAMKLEFENEDHTLCNIINDYLQNNKNVIFSGLSKPNLLIDNMIIEFQTIKSNPLQYFDETLDHVTKLFDEIETQLEKIGSDFIKYIHKNSNLDKKK